MSLTKEKAYDATEAVKQGVRDLEDRQSRDHDDMIKRSVDAVLEATLKDVDALIAQTIKIGNYYVTWTVDDSEINRDLRARVGDHYTDLGYFMRFDKTTVKMNDDSVDRLSLYLSWI